jgi:SPOR domain
LQRAHYTVSSRTVDDAHRPRIVRDIPSAPAHRPRPSRFTIARRHSKLGLVLCAVVAGTVTVVPVGTPHWNLLIAFSLVPVSSPPSPSRAPRAEGVTLSMPAAPPATPAEETLGSASTASGGTPSRLLDEPVPIAAADDSPVTGEPMPPAVRLGTSTVAGSSKSSVDDGERLGGPTTRSQRAPALAIARADPLESPQHRPIIVQLSSYNDEARARQAAEKLHRLLQKILRGAGVRTKKAQVHGRSVWRVVAGPITNRERANEVCEAVHHAGQSCIVTLL